MAVLNVFFPLRRGHYALVFAVLCFFGIRRRRDAFMRALRHMFEGGDAFYPVSENRKVFF